jgi:hypothetical protein
MDPNHLLTDVFEAAQGLLKARPGSNLQQVLKEAEKQVLQAQLQIMQGTIQSKRAALHKMLEEYQATGRPVSPRWANYTTGVDLGR